MVDQTARAAPASSAPPFVGRERELAILRDVLAAALAGRGSLVLIGGEAGIGKTALAEGLAEEAAAHGALALTGHCYDLAETPPYGPWIDLFGHLPAAPTPPPPPAAFATTGTVGAVRGQAALFQQVLAFVRLAATRCPLVLLLDDLHWADPASLDLLRFLARELAPLPVLILALYRTEDLTRQSPLFPLLPALVREAAARRLDLRMLDDAAICAWLRARYRLADPHEARLVTYLQARAEGNPFFTGELLRALEETGLLRAADGGAWALGDLGAAGIPPLLQQVLEGRVGRLGEAARDLLAVAAVIGQDVPLALWAAVGAVEEAALLDVVERAVGAHLLLAAADGTSVRFVHALVRETLYAGLLPPRRRGWHRRVGEALLILPAPGGYPPERVRHPDPDMVAHHFGRAGDARAFDWLIHAGLRARRAAAWLTAAERFAAAAALPDDAGTHARARGWLLFCRALLLILSDNAASLRALDEAEPLALAAGDRALATCARFVRGQLRCVGGDIRRGLAEMEREVSALEALPGEYHRRSVLDVALATLAALLAGAAPAPPVVPVTPTVSPVTPYRAYLVNWLGHTGRYREALALGEAFLAALAGGGDAPLALAAPAYLGLGHAHAALGRPDEALRAYARSRAGHAKANNARMIEFTLWCELLLAVLPYQADDVAERTRLAAEAAAAWERARGTITATPHDDPTDLLPALIEGRWAAACRLARDGLAAATSGHAHGAIGALGVLARHQGVPDAAWARVRALHPAGPATEPGDCHFAHGLALQALAADLALDAGDPATARTWVEAHERWLAWSGAVLWQADHQRLQARLALASGDLSAARAHAEAALAHATAPRQPLALLAAHRLLGELDTTAGRHANARSHLDAALALSDACAAPYERALTLLALAELRATGGRVGEAGALLAEVRAICMPLEARPALARADALAARLADTSPPPTAYPAGLTAREVEVLRLMAAGHSNRAIATALFLSPYTVERHLANLYAKTGAHGRAAATAFARRHRLA